MWTERTEIMTGDMHADDALNLRFCLREDVGIEDFEDRALVLLCDSLHLREINRQSRRLLALADGQRTLQDIVTTVATECTTPTGEMLSHAAEALLQMEQQGIVRRLVTLITERTENMHDAQYLVNPDVSFRPEDDDGAILFNADTDSLEVINPTAVEIWVFLAAPHTQAEVVAHLCEVCDGAPREDVEKDVSEFLETLAKKGFIGIVENPV
jgi:hypothetical protein